MSFILGYIIGFISPFAILFVAGVYANHKEKNENG
jgi:hypothetical protein